MPAIVAKCSCEHHQQDKIHGSGFRVMNQTKTKTGPNLFRCTVCASVRAATDK